jgi:SAM-dependent methyltransferase
MSLIKILKKIPIDLGQAELKHSTKGKLIGFNKIPKVGNKPRKALDIGCRDGYWSKKLIKKGYAVESVDIEPYFKPARKVNVDNGLPFENDSFDVVWCSEVIEHLRNPQRSVNEMIRVTKDGGKIVLTTPNSYFWLGRIFCLFGLSPQRVQNDDHKHFFDLFSLKKVLPKHAKVYGYFPYLILKLEIKRMINFLSPTFTIIINLKK